MEQKTVLTILYNFRNTADTGCNYRYFARHRLQCDQTKGVVLTGKEQDVGHGKKLCHIVLFAEKQNIVGYAEVSRKPLGVGPLRSVSDHQQLCAAALSHPGE